MSDAHYDWLLTYAKQHSMSVEGVVRLCIRMHNMVELTPGAREAVAALQPRMPMLLEADA